MGGNAVKGMGNVVRLNSKKYDELALDILGMISSETIIPRLVQSYHNKQDHGDMDIVVPSGFYYVNSQNSIKNKLGAVGYAKNGPVTSYAIPLTGEDVFQLDLITVPTRYLDFAEKYFNYNDLGNLLGRVAHRMGFKLGHHGLRYVLRDTTLTTHVIAEITVTDNWEEAIEFLGYSAERYADGFDDLVDIFEYTMSSPFAKWEIYLLENRNATSRIRDRKRKTYMSFLKWLETNSRGELTPDGELEESTLEEKIAFKAEHVLRAMDAFPRFACEVNAALDYFTMEQDIKAVFNGKVVSEITGLEGKDIGEFMALFRALHSDSYLAERTQEEIITMIKELESDLENATYV